MKVKIIILVCLSVLPVKSFSQEKFFTEPVKIPLLLSGNFGELRSNHFHTGIDIKTQGQTGLDIVAAADGYVSRISVSPGGYGKVLYIDHYNGTTTVYGHLLSYRTDLKNYIKNLQYQNESFSIDTKVAGDKFKVKKGEVIAKSGNSGSSGGPHLHFEIRDARSQIPENPLKYGFNITDKQPPRIFGLLVCPLDGNSHVNQSERKQLFQVALVNGKYKLANNQPIVCGGDIGLEIDAGDYLDGGSNRCGIYSLALKTDGETVFSFLMDRFSFAVSRYINSHFDYEYFTKSRRRFIRAWQQPGNLLTVYKEKKNRGIIRVEEGDTIRAELIIGDVAGNSAKLEFRMIGKAAGFTPSEPEYVKLFKYNRENEFKTDDFQMICPIGAFYDDVGFTYNTENIQVPFLSAIHHLHNLSIPVHNAITIKLKADNIPEELQSKVLVAGIEKETGKTFYAGGKYEDGWVETTIRSFGSYALAVDTIAPFIVPLSIKNNALTESNGIRFRISDSFSGIRSFTGRIDGKWALFEHDAKSDIIIHYFDAERFELKKRHNFTLTVTDNQGNQSVYESTFWK